jgi:hypothetical protein
MTARFTENIYTVVIKLALKYWSKTKYSGEWNVSNRELVSGSKLLT